MCGSPHHGCSDWNDSQELQLLQGPVLGLFGSSQTRYCVTSGLAPCQIAVDGRLLNMLGRASAGIPATSGKLGGFGTVRPVGSLVCGTRTVIPAGAVCGIPERRLSGGAGARGARSGVAGLVSRIARDHQLTMTRKSMTTARRPSVIHGVEIMAFKVLPIVCITDDATSLSALCPST